MRVIGGGEWNNTYLCEENFKEEVEKGGGGEGWGLASGKRLIRGGRLMLKKRVSEVKWSGVESKAAE